MNPITALRIIVIGLEVAGLIIPCVMMWRDMI